MESAKTIGIRKNIIKAVIIILVAVIAVIGLYIYSHYIFAGGELVPKDSIRLELAGKKVSVSELLRLSSPEYIDIEKCDITVDEYESLKNKYPECDIRWSVPLCSGQISNKSTEIILDSICEADLPMFSYFEDLKTIKANGLPEWSLLSALAEQYPKIEISWDVALNEKYYSSEATDILLDEPVSFSELNEKLRAFHELESVSLLESGLSTEEMLALQASYPAVSFTFLVEEFGLQISSAADYLDFSNNSTIDLDRLIYIAPLFTSAKTIDFTGCNYNNDEMLKVQNAFPGADVNWQFDIYGVQVSSLDEEIDFSGITISDTDEIENALTYFKKLKKVIMSDCGIGNEEMDALNKRHDDIRFVWTVYLGSPKRGNPRYELRTDTTFFISSLQLGEQNAYRLFDDTAEPLKYCTDIIALDLGHNKITKCEFCSFMPNLRFFIAAGSPLDDISPLSDCKKLYFVELQFCPVTDLSPLLDCKELRHLNVCACPTQDSVRTVLAQMTWLERCYMAGKTACYKSDYDYVYSDDFLPNTEKWLGISMGFYHFWRTHPSYFEMRDALGGAYYMAGRPSWMKEALGGMN